MFAPMNIPASFRSFALLALLIAAAVLGYAVHAGSVRHRAEALMRADPEAILADPILRETALALGRPLFTRLCASCHGTDGMGSREMGVPDLTDGDRLYGDGLLADVEQIVLHGIRSGDTRGWNLAYMPAYAQARPYQPEPIDPLKPPEVGDVAHYLRSLHGDTLDAAAAARGRALYGGKGGCWDCHGGDASGDSAIGAPNLVDDVWLYGDGSQAAIARSVGYGCRGMMPAFSRRLSPIEARAVAAYAAAFADHAQDPQHHGR
jgi:cytochrome c oxidase cbb3-type subunit 3